MTVREIMNAHPIFSRTILRDINKYYPINSNSPNESESNTFGFIIYAPMRIFSQLRQQKKPRICRKRPLPEESDISPNDKFYKINILR